MNGISSFECLESLVARFYARTLPREQWTHRAHLGVALWILRDLAVEEALEHLRREIMAYNESTGLENGPFSGYHETLTHFYVRAVASFLEGPTLPGKANEDELWIQLTAKWGDKNAIFAYYSRRYLFSPSARAHFAPPDLRPFSF